VPVPQLRTATSLQTTAPRRAGRDRPLRGGHDQRDAQGGARRPDHAGVLAGRHVGRLDGRVDRRVDPGRRGRPRPRAVPIPVYKGDLVPGLRAGVYGASFRFTVTNDHRNVRPRRSAYNPEGLVERTILAADVLEMGPVTWAAYAGATAGIRSLTDLST
jgi:hypothetical protein